MLLLCILLVLPLLNMKWISHMSSINTLLLILYFIIRICLAEHAYRVLKGVCKFVKCKVAIVVQLVNVLPFFIPCNKFNFSINRILLLLSRFKKFKYFVKLFYVKIKNHAVNYLLVFSILKTEKKS